MGDQVYAYRNQHSVSDDGWREKPYGGDKICRTIIYDKDGRHRTVTGCPPADSTTTATYVVKTDVTEHVGVPPPVFDYRRQSPAVTEQYGRYEVHRRPSSAPYGSDLRRRPQEVDEFLTGVQIEASRNNNNFRAPAAKGHERHGGYGDYRKGNDYYSSDEEDEGEDEYESDVEVRRQYHTRPMILPATEAHTRPLILPATEAYSGGGGWVSPVTHGVGNLSLPTNRIDEAVDYLTVKSYGSAKPAYGEVVRPYGTKYQTTEHVKPYGTATNNNSFGTVSNNKSTTYEETKYHNSTPEPVKPYGTTTDTKYQQSTTTLEAAKPYSGYGTVNKNTTEVSRTYGTKYNQAPEPVKLYGTAGYNGGTGTTTTSSASSVIDCYEAARKYNGKVIRT